LYSSYELAVSIIAGIMSIVIKETNITEFPEIEIFALSLAIDGFLLGEYLQASG